MIPLLPSKFITPINPTCDILKDEMQYAFEAVELSRSACLRMRHISNYDFAHFYQVVQKIQDIIVGTETSGFSLKTADDVEVYVTFVFILIENSISMCYSEDSAEVYMAMEIARQLFEEEDENGESFFSRFVTNTKDLWFIHQAFIMANSLLQAINQHTCPTCVPLLNVAYH